MSVNPAKHARELLLKEYRALVSTHSRKWQGFPFGSVVPYCLDRRGLPLLLISRIAQHTINLQHDPRCSLLIGQRDAADIQAAGRLTLLAEAHQLEDVAVADAAQRYYRYFPDAQDYHRIHDFDFWSLEPVQWRYIGGFGAIHWLPAESLPLANPMFGEPEAALLECLQPEHVAMLARRAQAAGLPAGQPVLVGLDAEGVHLRIGQSLYWLALPEGENPQQAFWRWLQADA